MKKIFLFLTLVVLLFTSCNSTEQANTAGEVEVKVDTPFGIGSVNIDIFKLDYNGHSYIGFIALDGITNIIHDPDCPCHNKINNE